MKIINKIAINNYFYINLNLIKLFLLLYFSANIKILFLTNNFDFNF